MKICVGMTTAGLIKSQTAFCLAKMLKETEHDYEIVFKEGPNQPLNREVIAETALKTDCTHILFIDSDMYFPPDALDILVGRDKDIIGVHYNTRSLPAKTTVKMNPEKKKTVLEDYPNNVAPCDAVASGFMLINTKVFDTIEKPWFHVGVQDGELEGHDYRFCRIVKDAGGEVWVDLNIQMGHIGDYIY